MISGIECYSVFSFNEGQLSSYGLGFLWGNIGMFLIAVFFCCRISVELWKKDRSRTIYK